MVPQASPRDPLRGRLVFSAADDAEERVHSGPIFVEPTFEEVLHRARDLSTHQLVSVLRSCLP